MFSALLRHDLVTDVVAFFDPAHSTLKFVVALGEDVCGYPRIVHGGLTAAIVDEACGHLFYALRCAGALPFRGPAFTASLTVDYRRKIGAGRVLLVTARAAECGGRKLRMEATVADGPGEGATVYARASALFVAPSTRRLLREGLRYAASYVAPGWVSVDGG
jgi:acyl-coenzyme A thioesterase PaaI-like protein